MLATKHATLTVVHDKLLLSTTLLHQLLVLVIVHHIVDIALVLELELVQSRHAL